PALAKWAAIADPITPAPTTATLSIFMQASFDYLTNGTNERVSKVGSMLRIDRRGVRDHPPYHGSIGVFPHPFVASIAHKSYRLNPRIWLRPGGDEHSFWG